MAFEAVMKTPRSFLKPGRILTTTFWRIFKLEKQKWREKSKRRCLNCNQRLMWSFSDKDDLKRRFLWQYLKYLRLLRSRDNFMDLGKGVSAASQWNPQCLSEGKQSNPSELQILSFHWFKGSSFCATGVKLSEAASMCVCVCYCLSHPSPGPKNEPHGFPNMEGKWQLRMPEARAWWERGSWSSNRAKSRDRGGINLPLAQGRMTQGFRAEQAPFFPLLF